MASKDKKDKKSKTLKNIDNFEEELLDINDQIKQIKEKEPVPESFSGQDVAENKSEFESYEQVSKALKENYAEIKKLNAKSLYLHKEADKLHAKTAKEARKKNRRNNSDPNKKPSGFETPVLIPDNFFKFISNGLKKNKFSEQKTEELKEKNYQADSMIPRSIVTRMVYDYVKTQQLYEDIVDENTDQNKRSIKPDEAIKTLFSMTENEEIGFFNFQTYVCRLFPKIDKSKKTSDKFDDQDVDEIDEVDEEVEEVEEVEEPEPEPEPIKKKTNKTKTVSSTI